MPRRKKLTREELAITLINKMFEIAGHEVRFDDIKGRTDNWYQQYTMTQAQNKEWFEYGKKIIKENIAFGARYADKEMRMFDLMYGLKISDPELL